MNFRSFTKLIALLLIASPFVANAQWYKRLEVGYSYVTATAQFKGKSGYYDLTEGLIGDTTVNRTIRAKAGAGYDVGLYIPLKQVGRKNMWVIGCHAIVNEFIWEGLNQAYTTDGSYYAISGFPDLFGATMQIGAPVSLEYKVGTDAICSKRIRFGFTAGGGIIPSYNITALVGVDGAGLGAGMGINPFVKAEFAVFGGICFKLRAQMMFGSVPYIDQSKNDLAFTSGPFKVEGKTLTSLSFIFMPFAWKWEDKEWFNTRGEWNPYQNKYSW